MLMLRRHLAIVLAKAYCGWALLAAMAACSQGRSPTPPEAGPPTPDTATPDASTPTASTPDAARPDAFTPDAGPTSAPSPGRFPDTTNTIAILSDQLPGLNAQQIRFAATHYVGSQKLVLDATRALRAINPNFVVLHYHLAMWQSAPTTNFIIDGRNWGNDYPQVTTHESWFWHNASGNRVPSSADGKLLMNVSDPDFAAYWADSLMQQTAAGEYDGVFLDSASPALLQGECGTADPRLAGTAARTQSFSELGGQTWIAAWDTWIEALDTSLASAGIPLIPNTSAFVTTWDNADYNHTAGIFVEGFADPGFAPSDWQASTNQILHIASEGKIVILQNYLDGTDDLSQRLYYLANYLLVKGSRTYLFYFAASTLEWYPEWQIDLGAPLTTPGTVDAMAWQGVYRRDYANGLVLVNPGPAAMTVALDTPMRRVDPQGGGGVPSDGSTPGTLATSSVASLSLAPGAGAVLLR